MKKWALIVDVAKCTNCQNCVLATKDEHMGNNFPGYSAPMPPGGADWLSVERRMRGNDAMVDVTYVPKSCNHCADAPCVRSAPDGAVYQRSDGIVLIDPIKARGRRDIVDSCPYGMITWNETAQLPQNWTFDAHLLDQGWSKPRSVQACPTGALDCICVDDAALLSIVERDGLEVLRPELNTRPRVYYRHLRNSACYFIGGTVVRATAGVAVDNVREATVELDFDGHHVATCQTDTFGDFKLDGLPPGPEMWTVRVSHPAYGIARASGRLERSLYIGTLTLTAP